MFLKNSVFGLLLTTIFIFSCAHQKNISFLEGRIPANLEQVPFSVDEVFSIRSSSDQLIEGRINTDPISYIKDLSKRTLRGDQLSTVFTQEVNLPEGVAYKIVPKVEDGRYVIEILHKADAFDDKVASVNLASFLQQINNRKFFNLFHEFFEMSFNAKLGDLHSIENLLKIKNESLDPQNMVSQYKNYDVTNVGFGKTLDQSNYTIKKTGKVIVSSEGAEDMLRFNEVSKAQVDLLLEQLEEPLKVQKRNRNSIEATRKALLKDLDRADDLEQLKSLAAAGKRKEAADLIDTYLPKEHMTPAEKQYWDTVLDIMRNPEELKDRILVFRGIDDDMVYPFIENGVELEREVAIKESKGIFMSSVMTKNQGTWNRRLRSLQTMYNKVLNQNIETGTNEFSKGARMTTMFHQHAMNPQGSPFLSWTPKIETAHMFGKKRASAFLMDSRLLMANYASAFTTELELLTPLITFPDEMVAIHDQTIHGQMGASGREKLFLKATKEKLIAEYGAEEGEKHFDEIKKIFDKHNKVQSVNNLDKPKKVGTFEKLKKFFKSFFQKLFKKGQEAAPELAPKVTEKQSCVFLIQSLMKAP